MRQRPLRLARGPDFRLETFVEGESNRDALTYLLGYPDWPSPVVLLIGPEGSGKTHIGRAMATEQGVTFIDDASARDELALFETINKALSGEMPGLILASRSGPSEWDIQTPDLRSRLTNIPTFGLEEPGDDILRPIVLQLFLNHGRIVGVDVVDYLLTRLPRAVPELTDTIEAIEAEAQSERADVTKTFVSRLLSRQPDLFAL